MPDNHFQFSCLMVISGSDNHVFLGPALSSIGEGQTCQANEYVLVLNGPLNDGAAELLSAFKEKMGSMVKLLNRDDMGTLSEALNQGLASCSYDLVARMDPDDIAMPMRFEKQLEAFRDNPELDICGTYIGEFDGDPASARLRKLPVEHQSIVAAAKWRNPLAHPSVMFKKQAILDIGGYPDIGKAQDYILWVKAITEGCELVNIPEQLLLFRSGEKHLNRRGWAYFMHEVDVFQRMRDMNFLSGTQFLANLILRAVVRIQPMAMKKLIYRIRR